MQQKVLDQFNDYVSRLRDSAYRHCQPGGMYDGTGGAKRLAREIGFALSDFTNDEREIRDLISRTYSCICVMVYHLKPPIDASVWAKEMFVGAHNSLEYRKMISREQKKREDIEKQYSNDKRYMRYEANPFRGNRYAIYERNSFRPDNLIFCTLDRRVALDEWERIKDYPVKDYRRDFIDWS